MCHCRPPSALVDAGSSDTASRAGQMEGAVEARLAAASCGDGNVGNIHGSPFLAWPGLDWLQRLSGQSRGCRNQRSQEPCSACCGVQTGSSSPDFTVAMAAAGLAKPQRFHPQKYVWERGRLEEEGLVGRIAGKGSSANAARSPRGGQRVSAVRTFFRQEHPFGRCWGESGIPPPRAPLRASESPWP